MPLAFLGILVAFFAVMTGGRFVRPTSLKIIFDQALLVGTISTGAVFIFSMGIMVASALLSTVLKVRVMFVTIVMMTLLSSLQQTTLGGSTVSLPYEMIQGLSKARFSYIVFALHFVFSGILFHCTAIGRSCPFQIPLGQRDSRGRM